VPTFIGADASAFNAAFGAARALLEAQDDLPATNGDAPEGRKRGGRGGDLRKKTLKSEAGKSARRRGGHAAATPPANGKGSAVMLMDGLGSASQAGDNVPAGPPRRHVFFANSGFYVLLRLLEVLHVFVCPDGI
jgi:paired amphipathic helix protein Sin3a